MFHKDKRNMNDIVGTYWICPDEASLLILKDVPQAR